jgi:hypothetical protein
MRGSVDPRMRGGELPRGLGGWGGEERQSLNLLISQSPNLSISYSLNLLIPQSPPSPSKPKLPCAEEEWDHGDGADEDSGDFQVDPPLGGPQPDPLAGGLGAMPLLKNVFH